jgi:hypothetical protein
MNHRTCPQSERYADIRFCRLLGCRASEVKECPKEEKQ